jgi:Lysylphosphatidylglycerol synthase TM region
LNKSTKIWLNYLAGGSISVFLLWSIYTQVVKQLNSLDATAWQHTGSAIFLVVCVALMLVNTSLEGFKWYVLSNAAGGVGYRRAYSSYLAGVAFSIITPNRIGEYPGRILYLRAGNTFRYITVSVLGVLSQLWTVYLFGLAALVYYNICYPAVLPKIALGFCLIANVAAAVVFLKFGVWLPKLQRFSWVRRFGVYGKLLNRVDLKKQILVLAISIARFAIFTAQYLILMKWLNVDLPAFEGFMLCALFFWVMAVIPSVALTELGVRGSVSLFLFQHFSTNTVGMLAATAGIWFLNLIVPSVIGSILILRMRILG